MSTDPTLDAALRSIRPNPIRRFWNWYKAATGYERPTPPARVLRIRSTYFPNYSTPAFPADPDQRQG